MNLEDFRNQPFVGEIALQNPFFGGSHLPYLFHDTSNAAFYMTIDALNRMESSGSIGGNGYCIPGVGLWFHATESYISTIYKLALAESTITKRSISPAKKLMEKLDQTNQYFDVPTSPSLRNQLQEFATFRNGIFHDLTLSRNTKYSHTLFTSQAEKLNEVDLFQSVQVALQVFTYYRYLFEETDFMPQIYINAQFEDLDKLANEILYPAFKEILELKGVSTALDLSVGTLPSYSRNYPIQIRSIISHQGPLYPKVGSTSRVIAKKYLDKAVSARPIDPQKFRVPNYTRNKVSQF